MKHQDAKHIKIAVNHVAFIMLLCMLTFETKTAVAQDYRDIQITLNDQLVDSLIRGRHQKFSFHIENGDLIFDDMASPDDITKKVPEIISKHKTRFTDGRYILMAYWDRYDKKVYTALQNDTEPKGLFINHGEHAAPRGGFQKFVDQIISDINRNPKELPSSTDYSSLEIKFNVDKSGFTTFYGNKYLASLLDSAKMLKWTPRIGYGYPLASNYSMNLYLKKEGETLIFRNIKVDQHMSLDNKFKGQFVSFDQDRLMDKKYHLDVSFVFDPLGNGFIAPIIHNGDTDVAREFLEWLQQNFPEQRSIHYEHYPMPERYHFFIGS